MLYKYALICLVLIQSLAFSFSFFFENIAVLSNNRSINIGASNFLSFSEAKGVNLNLSSTINHIEVLLIGLLIGLVLVFFTLSILSKIKPYVLCSFWFVSLLLLYMWRSGYVFLLFPNLEGSSYQNIYFFILQSIPVITYLIITKAVTVLQTKDYKIFQKVFSAFLWLSISYLLLVMMASSLNVDLLTNYFKLVQRVFWVLLGLLGIPSLAWLVLSSRRNLNFYKFQSSFGLLFMTALLGKLMLNPADFPAAFLKPTHLLFGIVIQLFYMFWLLLSSIFEIQDSQPDTEDINEVIVSRNDIVIKENSFADISLLKNLSPRELDIITAYCNGFSYNEISSSFLISPNTVKSHLKSCYRKLKVNSKVEAINIMNQSKELDTGSNSK